MGSFGELIASIRAKSGLGYERFARDVLDGVVSHQTVKDLELGTFRARIPTIEAIRDKLELDPHEVAHLAFDLPEPGEMDEGVRLEGMELDLLEGFRDLDPHRKGELLGYLARMMEEQKNA